MTTIETSDDIGGSYMDENPGGIFGQRWSKDRRFWLAWAAAIDQQNRDCLPGVMDDFGRLVPVLWPQSHPQH